MERDTRDWCVLPSHLLSLIFSRLCCIFDYVSCQLVCTSWRSAVDAPPKPRAPLLLLPDADPNFRNLFCLSDRKLHRIRLPLIAGSLEFPGSTPDGFLATIDSSANLHLINPITGAHVPLPPITTFSEVVRAELAPDQDILCELKQSRDPRRTSQVQCAYYRKLALFPVSASSSSPIAFVIHGGSLAFSRPGDESWTEISSNTEDRYGDYRYGDYRYGFHDVVHHKGQFYAVRDRGSVVAFDFTVFPPRETLFPEPTPGESVPIFATFLPTIYYLAPTADGANLLLVRRFLVLVNYKPTVKFQVFKLETGERKWVEVQSFGKGSSTALFLGTNLSLSVCTKDSPELKENCIYNYPVDARLTLKSTGTYCIEDGRVESLFPSDDPQYDHYVGPLPVWFMPNFS